MRWKTPVAAVAAAIALMLSGPGAGRADRSKDPNPRANSEVRRGFAIAPVPLDLAEKNPALVGKGSYLVNGVGLCNDCHTCPTYSDNPFAGDPGQINADNHLAGGVPFGPFTAANLTPDEAGLPGGMTLEEFMQAIRQGVDPSPDEAPEPPIPVLQVMPWPILRNMTDRDLRAIYEYLRAIPSADPGQCAFPGQPADGS